MDLKALRHIGLAVFWTLAAAAIVVWALGVRPPWR